jgi:hypothetical protein
MRSAILMLSDCDSTCGIFAGVSQKTNEKFKLLYISH